MLHKSTIGYCKYCDAACCVETNNFDTFAKWKGGDPDCLHIMEGFKDDCAYDCAECGGRPAGCEYKLAEPIEKVINNFRKQVGLPEYDWSIGHDTESGMDCARRKNDTNHRLGSTRKIN
jgi:hypothetical protein